MTVVVQRSFIIERGAHREFERLWREGIWPYFEARGCKIVGYFTNVHGGATNEVITNTAYASLAHWEATRDDAPLPDDASEKVRALYPGYQAAAKARRDLIQVSSSRVFRLASEWVDYSVHEG